MTKMIDTVINGQFKIILPEHRAERPDWYTEEGWEKARLKSIYSNTTKDDVMFYVGAEEGEMPALSQMWGADVVLFEPNPKVWSNIKEIWKANKLDDPITFQGFCSNETRIVDDSGQLQHGFPECADLPIEAAHGFKELYLEAKNYNQTKIDDVTSIIPTQMSIDVEGSEFEVLKGAEQTIIKHKPKIWLSLHPEFLFAQWNVYGTEVRNWIKDKGYKETLLDYKHEVHFYYEPI